MTQNPAVSHCVFIRAYPGRSVALGECLGRLVESTLGAAGCLQCAAQRAAHDPSTWMLSAQWASADALAGWLASPNMDVFSLLVRDRLIIHLDVQAFDSVITRPAAPALRYVG
ncbi:putative quinol monooxygenase [Pseudomonas typographi]|nr:antibiotic biosynthesis monooxygenase family protein [Pseudomonas typographi]MBD1553371.1 antibiotic biosynthesis monooxygenase [Pseudomonas typographi]MBD1585735.1 antibiotic biosynthesis monooxygenase [Pseudomonas typographi]